jgi:capsular exopolysaccharide synthesis family protein
MNNLQQPMTVHLSRPRRAPSASVPPVPMQRGPAAELLAALGRRWRIIAATVGLVVGGTAAYCGFATPRYQAQALVLIEASAPQVLNGPQFGAPQDPLTSGRYDYYQTQFQLLESPSLARRVIGELRLADDARFGAAAPASEPALVSRYLAQLTVQPVRNTRLVTILFESTDPALAAEVANTHASLFVRSGLEQLYASIERIQAFLRSKLEELQPRMQEAEARLLQFQSANHLLPVNLGEDVASERLMDLSRRLTAAEAERIALQAQYQLVQRREYDGLPAVLNSPLIQRLRGEYDRLEVEHALLAQKFRPSYPRLQQLAGQLAHARDQLGKETVKVVAGVEASYLAAERTVEQLKAELEEQRRSLLHRKDAEGEFLTLVREAETSRSLYDSLLARIKDLNVAGGPGTSNVTVVEPATPPRSPSSPDTSFNIALAVVTSLVLGTGLALLRDASDRTIRDAYDVRWVTGLGTLAVIPDLDRLPGTARERRWSVRPATNGHTPPTNGASGTNGHGKANGTHAPRMPEVITAPSRLIGQGMVPPMVEAYRTLRTSLLLSSATSPRILVLTSAVSGEGKTTTAVNTAAALARCGARVLLIDGDLRLPGCAEALGQPAAPGLAEFLAGDIASEPIQTTGLDNLSFLAAGRPVPNPTELLGSERMAALVGRMRTRFEFVVIDTPPLLAVSDGLLLANLADGAVLVVERDRTRQQHVASAVEQLRDSGALPLGTVLNRGTMEPEYYRYSRAYSIGAAALAAPAAPAAARAPEGA